MFVLLNGDLFLKEKAALYPNDRGFLLGDGVFTTLLSKKGQLLCFDAHFERLLRGTKTFHLPPPDSNLESKIMTLLDHNNLLDDLAAVRITITRGAGGRGITPSETVKPTILITAASYERPSTPLRVMISSIRRESTSPLCHIKHLGYQSSILARLEALEKGYDDALMLNTKGNLVCATAGNLFLVCEGEILTPPLSDGALPGIMRGKLIQDHKTIKICPLTPKDLGRAETAFITNSLAGIQMIGSVLEKHLSTEWHLF